jgi:spermidine dehydrogenase
MGPVNPNISVQEMVDQFPVSGEAKQEFLHLFTIEEDQLPDLSQEEKVAYLKKISYREFLIRHIGVTEQEVFDFFQDHTADMGLGIGSADAYLAMTYAGMRGWAATGIETYEKGDLTGFHMFPDGNASVTRLMVRSLIPDVAPGNTMEDVVMARFDYSKLDQSSSHVRVRLNSTVIKTSNDADGNGTTISYIRDEKAYQVKAKQCVLACNNAVIPYICPDLPDTQKEALSNQVRQPLLSSRVLVKNWHAWKELGISNVLASGGYHTSIDLNIPINIGGYSCPQEPDEPIIIGMYRRPHVSGEGLTAQEQFRMGRHELLATPFEDIERHIRTELDELLGDHGFNAAEDIEAITVNRWAHGYAYSHHFHFLFDQDYEDPDDERYPHVKGRKPMGNITIANSDSGADAMLECAIDQAYRAVSELQDV